MVRFSLAVVLFAACSAFAQDASRGKLLYETHCIRCHREGLHDRQNSKVASYADLRFQVQRWSRETGASLSRDDQEDLIGFLDASHYRLDERPPTGKP